jgi:hypothetical protein
VFPAWLVHRFDRWQDIVNALIEGMIERGTLSGTEVDEIIPRVIAARSIKIEHQCGDDWRQRKQSARAFQAENVPWVPSST